MRALTKIAACLILLVCAASPVCAQILPWNIVVDSDFRVEFLLGRQTLGREFTSSDQGHLRTDLEPVHVDPLDRLNIQFGPRVPVIEAVIEASPSPSVSGRLTGSTSVLESVGGYTLVSGPSWTKVSFSLPYPYIGTRDFYYSTELTTSIKPTFWSWEAAGLYHITSGGGYRYSIVGGYRQELWRYVTTWGQDDTSYMRDEFVSQAPFLGLQTAMFFPWWKARFEVLGSPFMIKKISHSATDQGYYQQLDGSWRNGGFIEFQVEGTVNMNYIPGGWIGVFARYTYEELRGQARGTRYQAHPNIFSYETFPYDFYTLKTMGTIGFNFNVVF